MSIMTKVSIYINEADQWQHRPLYLELLNMLYKKGIAEGTVLHAVAGFSHMNNVQTSSLVDVGSKLPLLVQFIDSKEKVDQVLPELRKMSGSKLIIREEVEMVV